MLICPRRQAKFLKIRNRPERPSGLNRSVDLRGIPISPRGNHRMTRLTNAFSKKAENHAHMMAIYFMHYNFVRIHQTLRITPEMAAGVTGKLWEMADMVAVLERWESSNDG
jgi:hypothetical protein